MRQDHYTLRCESIHDCGYVFQQTVMHLDNDQALSFVVKPDPPFDFERPFTVIAGPYTPPPPYKTKIELVAHCSKVEVNGVEWQDDRLICPKCGADILLPERNEASQVSEMKHDGTLGGDIAAKATVEYDSFYRVKHISISGGYGYIESRDVTLDAKQALFLLAWLRQEEETLEQLAKEQAE